MGSRSRIDHLIKQPDTYYLSWSQFVRDYVNTGLSVEFFEALCHMVKSVSRRLPARFYSPIGIWDNNDGARDDAVRTIVTDVLVEQVKRGHLEKLYYSNKLDAQIYCHFRNAVKWHLDDIADKHGANCLQLHQEIQLTLKRNEVFQYFGNPDGWGLKEWIGHNWLSLPEDKLLDRIKFAEIPSMRRTGKKRRIIPTKSEIRAFIEALLETVGYPIPVNKLVDAARVHFNVYDIMEFPWLVYAGEETSEEDQPAELPSPRDDYQQIELREVIENFCRTCGKSKRRLLYNLREHFLNGRKQGMLVQPGYKKSSVSNDKRRLEALLRKLPVGNAPMSLVEQLFAEVLNREKGADDAPSDGVSRAWRTGQDSGHPKKGRRRKTEGNKKATVLRST